MVSVTARTKGLRTGLANSVRSLGKFARSIGGAIIKVVKFAAVIGVAAVAALALFVKRAFTTIDETAKLADRIGTTTEAISRLGFAASIAGADQATLNKALSRMLRTIGEVRQRGGEAGIAFEALGISADKLAAQDPAASFSEIADAIAKLDTQADKTAATVAIFGRSGEALVNTLALGSKGLKAMGLEADELGLTFNRIDAAKIEQANDAITKLKSIFTGIVQKVAILLAPIIENIANNLTAMGTNGKAAAIFVIKGLKSILLGVAFLLDFLKGLKIIWLSIKFAATVALGVVALAITAVATVAFRVLRKFKLVGKDGSFARFVRESGNLVEEMANQAEKAGREIGELATSGSSLDAVEKAFRGVTDASDALAKSTSNTFKIIGQGSESFADMQKRVKATRDIIVKLREQIDNFGKTQGEIQIEKLVKAGGTAEQVATAKNLVAQFQRLKALQEEDTASAQRAEKLAQEGAAIFDATRNPMEKFQKRINKLSTLLQQGAINQDTFNRAAKAAGEDIIPDVTDQQRGTFQVVQRNRVALDSQLKPLQTEAAKAAQQRERSIEVQVRIEKAIKAGVFAVAF